jgi:hypothetical protein
MKSKVFNVLLIASCAISQAQAEDSFFPPVKVSGFGTLAVTRSNTDDAEFARPNQARGVTKRFQHDVDSNLGIQAYSQINNWLSVTGQTLIRKDTTDDFSADLSLAFVKLKASDDFSVRIGRVGLPIYMISDYRNVAYANTMMRPPIELYYQVTVDYVDGVDFMYQKSFGDTSLTAQVVLGRVDSPTSLGYTLYFRQTRNINLVAENGPFTVRFGRSSSRISAPGFEPLTQLVGGLRQTGFDSIADRMEIKNSYGSFTSLGAGMDWKNIVVQTEYGKLKTDLISIPSGSAWYAMFGYRFGKFLPYFNHGVAKQDVPRSVPGLPDSGPLLDLTLGVNAFAASAPVQTSNAIGVRWDFSNKAAFKMQLDRYSPKDGVGTFINAKPEFKGPVTVLAAGIDFVF